MSDALPPGPGALRAAPGRLELNADRSPAERITLVIVNTGDRPVQIGSHLHLPDANSGLRFDRAAARGFRLDIPSGTSQRFEPGASREVAAVALRGARRVPGIQRRPWGADAVGAHVGDEEAVDVADSADVAGAVRSAREGGNDGLD
ncbi:urease subunit beta [Galbitalea soli]|uniref:Urease subunit beta n=1 Tax=Galbitalea soli TaxID=1268042 RepID=A0A7C9PL66_9MICO|nr:urease subunit beta [Galbitalea soli]NEM89946.1 urease subunit beta [Galbitalea soli]NYJ30652.1 urease beta subunit [Galbitalea soli]